MWPAFALAATLALAQAITVEGGRPRECSETRTASANVWERAKSPELRRYCEVMSLAAARLASSGSGKDVMSLLDEAERVVPGRTPTLVLRGRSLFRIGRTKEAYEVLAKAVAADAQALSDPAALLAFARAAARSGAVDKSRAAYLALMPRADLLPAEERARSYVEAGFSAMSTGADGLAKAAIAFREARRDAPEPWAEIGKFGLALVLDRQGNREDASALVGGPRASEVVRVLASGRVVESLDNAGVPAELDAMRAIALERSDATAARGAWRKYADAVPASAPFRAHAEARTAGSVPTRRAP